MSWMRVCSRAEASPYRPDTRVALSSVLDLEALLTIALFVGSVVLGLQIFDAIISVIDARSVPG